MNQKIPFTVEFPVIGKIDFLLSIEQVTKALNDGKEIIKNEDKTDTSNYIYRGGRHVTTDEPRGFTGNTVDWDSFFPDVTMDDIKSLSEKALQKEQEFSTLLIGSSDLVGIALSSYLNAGKIDVSKIIDSLKEKINKPKI